MLHGRSHEAHDKQDTRQHRTYKWNIQIITSAKQQIKYLLIITGAGEQNIQVQEQTRKLDEAHTILRFAAFQGPQEFGCQKWLNR